ncbi:hypothetical protein ACGFNX_11170 [Streptomyces sp. NPDC048723]
MSDDQHDEATARPVAAKTTRQAGRPTLDAKTIQGQVITHTSVKPLK